MKPNFGGHFHGRVGNVLVLHSATDCPGASRNLALSSTYSASWNNCLKTIHVSLTCENQPIKYLARDPRVDICISLQLYHERNYTTMPSPDLIGRLPGISIWELHRQTYTNTTPVPCVCTICSPSCRIARKLLSIPTLDIALRWLADGLCVFTLSEMPPLSGDVLVNISRCYWKNHIS